MTLLPDSLASRLALWQAGTFVLFFSIGLPVFYHLIGVVAQNRMDQDLIEDIEEFHDLWRSEGIQRVRREIQREIGSDDPSDLYLRLLTSSGEVLYATDMSHWKNIAPNRHAIDRVIAGDDPQLETLTRASDGDQFRVVYGIIAPDQLLEIAETLEPQKDFMELLLHLFVGIYLVVVPFGALVGWWLARRALRSVEEVSLTAEAIADGNLNRHVTVRPNGSEITRLVTTFNAMIDRVQTLITAMREMTDNIAHDMRGPLARIRANAELALVSASSVDEFRESAADTLEECERLLQMINTTLDVAETEAGAGRQPRDRVDPARLASEACELFEPVAEDRRVTLTCKVQDCGELTGNRQQLQRMLANLVDNGLKFTDQGGAVTVAVERNADRVSIRVHDTGIGIAKPDRERIFERFVRCDPSRSRTGFGLGLSFCRAVARAHGGDITVASEPGKGSLFTVTLPLAAQRSAVPEGEHLLAYSTPVG